MANAQLKTCSELHCASSSQFGLRNRDVSGQDIFGNFADDEQEADEEEREIRDHLLIKVAQNQITNIFYQKNLFEFLLAIIRYHFLNNKSKHYHKFIVGHSQNLSSEVYNSKNLVFRF